YNAGSAGRSTSGPYFTNGPALADGYTGQAYAQTISTTRGTPPVTYALLTGALPGGITLSSSGLLSGTPTNNGLFNFVLRATDNAARSADQSFSLQVYSQATPAPGIISWWRAENNTLDAIGANNGTLTNGVTYAAGKVGQSFLLNGANGYIVVPDAPSLRPASVTLESWVRISSTNGTQLIMAKPLGSGTFDSYGLALANGIPLAAICDTSGFGPFISATSPLVLEQWYHVAFTFDDATKQQALYVNGSMVASSLANKTMSYDAQPLQLGADIENGVPGLFLSGQMDEAAIYNRALGSNEIAAIYLAGTGGKSASGPYFTNSPALPPAATGQAYNQLLGTARSSAPVSFSLVAGS
ncbi:MAG: LamG-like jellyroll fold domain-containing protein, partial [Limisphaerales bacterium]